jgi:hypothetical protein
MFVATGRKTGIKLRRSGTLHVAPTELFEIFNVFAINVSPLRGWLSPEQI